MTPSLEPPPGGTILEDSQLEPPPGGVIVSSGQQNQEQDMKNIAIALAKHLFVNGSGLDVAKAAVPSMLGQVIPQDVQTAFEGLKNFGSGVKQGFQGQPQPTDSVNTMIGQEAGKLALPLAGAALAAPTGGASLIPAAAAVGLGAAGGEGVRQIGAALTGGQQLTPEQSAGGMERMGIETALSDLGIGIISKAAKAAIPTLAEAFKSMPAESIKRLINNPDAIPWFGSGDRAAIERKAVSSLESVQNSFSYARKRLGQSVDNALQALASKTGNAPVYDATPAIKSVEKIFDEAALNNKAISEAASSSDIKKVNDILDALRENPNLNAKELVSLRKRVDGLTSFSRGGVPVIQSDLGSAAVKTLGSELRAGIAKVAEDNSFTGLQRANANFSSLANAYDEVASMIRTPNTGDNSMLAKVVQLAGKFNKGGLQTEIVNSIGKNVPKFGGIINKQVNRLVDYLAARSFAMMPRSSESGVTMTGVRALTSPGNIGRALKIANKIPAGTARSAAVSAIEESGKFNGNR